MAARSINKAILIGNLGQDPELRYTSGGVAVRDIQPGRRTETWKDQDGNAQEKTQWHNLVGLEKIGGNLRRIS